MSTFVRHRNGPLALTPHEKAVVELFAQGLSRKEIALRLKTTPASVASTLMRARDKKTFK